MGQNSAPDLLYDYLLLLGCLTMLTFIAYLQYQYTVFGNQYGLATFIPMVILFAAAYYFDHIGVLSLAITSFAAWFGISITPVHIWQSDNFDNSRIIFTGIGLGLLLLVYAYFTKQRKLKPHFEFTYNNFGTHVLLFSLLAAMLHFEPFYFIWFIVFIAIAIFIYVKAMREQSFYFLLVIVLYSYVAISYIVIRFLQAGASDMSLSLGMLYFIGSAIGMVYFLIQSNKKLKANDSL